MLQTLEKLRSSGDWESFGISRNSLAATHIIKIGSSSLVDENGKLRNEVFKNVAEQCNVLRSAGQKIILVTSGVVAAGRAYLHGRSNQSFAAEIIAGRRIIEHEWQQVFKTCHFLYAREETLTGFIEAINGITGTGIAVVNGDDLQLNSNRMLTRDNDALAVYLSIHLQARDITLITNSNGVLDEAGKTIANLTATKAREKSVSLSGKSRAGTGGISAKLRNCCDAADEAKNIRIISCWENGGILLAAYGKAVGTSISADRLEV